MERRIFEASFMFNSGFNTESIKYSDENIVAVVKNVASNNKEIFHTHNFFEFELIFDGEGENSSATGDTPISRGSLIFETPASMHSLKTKSGEKLSLANVEFAGELEQVVLDSIGTFESFCIKLSEEQLGYIEGELREILSGQDNANHKLLVQGAARKMIAYIADIVKQEGAEIRDRKTTSAIAQAILYIRRNYAKRLRLSEVAKTVNFTPNYLGTLIKSSTGRTFMQYLLDIRLDNAYRLLACTDKSVKEICIEVGYSSYSNFFYAFKEKFGIQPTELKKLSHDQKAKEFFKKRAYINGWES